METKKSIKNKDKFHIIKPTRCTNFSKFIFGIKLYMFRTVLLSIIRNFSLYTQQWYMSYRFVDSLLAGSGRNWPAWHIPLPCVQWKSPDDGQTNCPKHVEFYSKNKFEELVYLVDFIIWIYQDAGLPERQIKDKSCRNPVSHALSLQLSHQTLSVTLSPLSAA